MSTEVATKIPIIHVAVAEGFGPLLWRDVVPGSIPAEAFPSCPIDCMAAERVETRMLRVRLARRPGKRRARPGWRRRPGKQRSGRWPPGGNGDDPDGPGPDAGDLDGTDEAEVADEIRRRIGPAEKGDARGSNMGRVLGSGSTIPRPATDGNCAIPRRGADRVRPAVARIRAWPCEPCARCGLRATVGVLLRDGRSLCPRCYGEGDRVRACRRCTPSELRRRSLRRPRRDRYLVEWQADGAQRIELHTSRTAALFQARTLGATCWRVWVIRADGWHLEHERLRIGEPSALPDGPPTPGGAS
jgi:hypothetical protein